MTTIKKLNTPNKSRNVVLPILEEGQIYISKNLLIGFMHLSHSNHGKDNFMVSHCVWTWFG